MNGCVYEVTTPFIPHRRAASAGDKPQLSVGTGD